MKTGSGIIIARVSEMTQEQTTAELRELAFPEILALFEGDQAAASRWIASSVRGLGNHTPVSLVGTKPGIQKARKLIAQLEYGVFP